ncbi:DC1 - like 10, partial [Theobroma cacao]
SIKEDDCGEYYCDICEEKRDPTHQVYYCKKCTYITHIQCVLNKDKTSAGKVSSSAPESMDSEAFVEKEMEEFGTIDDHLQQTLVRPLIHEHPLKFCEATEKFEHQYCRACRLTLSGPGYICEECPLYIHGYYLHDKCSHLPSEIQHPLHSHHGLNLYTRPPHMVDFIICDECGDISPGFIYLCEECDFKLDVKCAMRAVPKSELSTLKEAERETELFHFSHKHKLLFCNFRDPTYKRQCSFCRLQIFGPTYYCFRCGWVLHESCLKLPQVMQVPIHPQHILALSYARYGFCHACALKLLSAGYSYSCEECYLSFHITCADSLRRALKRDSHMHDLYYFGTEFQRFFAMKKKYCLTWFQGRGRRERGSHTWLGGGKLQIFRKQLIMRNNYRAYD